MADLDTITRRLLAPIPEARTPKAKSAKSWASLKVGQHLEATDTLLTFQVGDIKVGDRFVVVGVDSQGMDLRRAGAHEGHLRWTLRDWQQTWKKVRKRKDTL